MKAAEFDQVHKQAPRWGKNNAGAKELAGGYTKGELVIWFSAQDTVAE